MSELLLSARNLSVRFGGVLAVNDVSFDVQRGEVFTLIGPNGAGKTTVFNLIGLLYAATQGKIFFEGRDLTSLTPHRVADLGIARTFQNIELFEHATVLQNLLIGRHRHRRTALWQELLFLPSVRAAELAQREAVEKVIDLLDLAKYRDSLVAGLPYMAKLHVFSAIVMVGVLPFTCLFEALVYPIDRVLSFLRAALAERVRQAWGVLEVWARRGATALSLNREED